MAQRIKTVQESDLRMLGDLARSIQRVLPVTQADIDAAAALGKGWVVTRVFEVSDPLDNLRGGTQLVIRQNSIQPGQSVQRVLIVSGPGGQTVVIRGTDYIVLPDAIANSLSYVKAFGGTEQRNIPQPYTQVNYVTNTAQTAVNTGIMIDFAKNYEFEVECRAVSGSWYILQSRASSSGNVTGIHGETSGSNIKLVVGNVTVCTSAITRTVGNKLYVKATLNAGTATLYVKDETANTEDTQTGSYGTTQPNPTAAVYLLGNAGEQYVDVNSDIYMARIKENGVTVMDYVPARQVATAGFYDKVSGTFKTALTPANLVADGNTVPTPDAPMDIVSNNGALKVRHQSGLPWGHTLLDFVTNASGTRINTGIYDDIDDFSIEIRVEPSSGSWYICQSRANSTAQVYGLSGASSGAKITMGVGFSGGSVTSNIIRATTHIYTVIGSHKNGVATIYVKDETTGNEDTQTTTYDTNNFTAAPTAIGVWGQSSNTINANNDIYYLKIRKGGVLVADYVPCQYNGENGFYDFVTKTFLGATVGTINAGNPVSDPAVVYADGTVETIAVTKDYFTREGETTGVIISADGVVNDNANYSISAPFVLSAGNYTCSWAQGTSGNRPFSVFECDAAGNIIPTSSGGQIFYDLNATGTGEFTLDTQKRVRFCYRNNITSGAIVGTLGTATAEMLLKVGDYQDVQSIIDGTVTRNVGILVLDGTENWSGHSTITGYLVLNMFDTGLYPDAESGYCTHYSWTNSSASYMPDRSFNFKGASSMPRRLVVRDKVNGAGTGSTASNAFKAYLAAQYAAGTPVIIVYPLATPTTESVAGQTLQVTSGDNVLEITQASLDGLELEAEYQAAVSLTIQEVQDANLDNNVEVTIS